MKKDDINVRFKLSFFCSVALSFCLSVLVLLGSSYFIRGRATISRVLLCPLRHCRAKSFGWIGWDSMVIIGQWSSKGLSLHFLFIYSFALHFLILSSFPHSLFVSSQPGCKAATINNRLYKTGCQRILTLRAGVGNIDQNG